MTCRSTELQTVETLVKTEKVIGSDDKEYGIQKIACAYNRYTKDTRMYMEVDRMTESIMEVHLNGLGVTSVSIDSFGQLDWRSSSEKALQNVLSCTDNEHFVLLKRGLLQHRADHPMM